MQSKQLSQWSIEVGFVANRPHDRTLFCQSLICMMGFQVWPHSEHDSFFFFFFPKKLVYGIGPWIHDHIVRTKN